MRADDYLASVAAEVRGFAPGRLLSELRDHIDDAVLAGEPELEAVRALGAAEEIAHAWRAHVRRRRSQTRRRAGALTLAVAIAASLAVAQHASGHRPAPVCRTAPSLSEMGRSAHCPTPDPRR